MISFAILLFVGCATAGILDPFDSKIVGGLPANIENYPYQVSVQVNTRHICGGSILNERYILTAAHCTYKRTPNGFGVRAGSTSRSWGGSFHQVKRIIQHPNYNPNNIDFDYSILELSTPIKFDNKKQPVTLAKAEPADDINIVLTGWGATGESQASVDSLLYTVVQTISRDECKSDYAGRSITQRMICALANGKDSCQGDSGGPMVDEKTKVQYGVVSWGIGCARPGNPGVYSNIADQLDWILENTSA